MRNSERWLRKWTINKLSKSKSKPFKQFKRETQQEVPLMLVMSVELQRLFCLSAKKEMIYR